MILSICCFALFNYSYAANIWCINPLFRCESMAFTCVYIHMHKFMIIRNFVFFFDWKAEKATTKFAIFEYIFSNILLEKIAQENHIITQLSPIRGRDELYAVWHAYMHTSKHLHERSNGEITDDLYLLNQKLHYTRSRGAITAIRIFIIRIFASHCDSRIITELNFDDGKQSV